MFDKIYSQAKIHQKNVCRGEEDRNSLGVHSCENFHRHKSIARHFLQLIVVS